MLQAFRGKILHCLRDPGEDTDDQGRNPACEYFEDGLLLVRNGLIERVGPASELMPNLPDDIELTDHTGRWIMPGFIDCHVHYPQIDMIASHGRRLLDWLETYTYPTESRFADQHYANDVAQFFVDELLRNGTTTAMVFATVHSGSVDAIFNAAQQRNMRLYSGKVLMDRNCPEQLRDTVDAGYRDSRELIERWHGQDRLGYAITPRFAPTSSEKQLASAGLLAAEYPDVHIHTHLAETEKETAWVAELFPQRRSYLDVYEHAGLVRERAIYAHCLHLDDTDLQLMSRRGSAIAFCPSSNLFLGSGLFDLGRARRHAMRLGLGTDVGGGCSLNLFDTIEDAYKVCQLQDQQLTPWQAFYFATLGAANALYIDDKLGNFAVGKEADFIIVDDQATPLTRRRSNASRTLAETLFSLMILGDDRMIHATYLQGQPTKPGSS